MCRQHSEKPNLFFTVAPAEWKFPLHRGMLGDARDSQQLAEEQTILTIHMYHTLVEVIEGFLLKKGMCQGNVGIEDVIDYSLRFEFQGRGT
eukprot:6581066-Karenia_brevis.AAC.1